MRFVNWYSFVLGFIAAITASISGIFLYDFLKERAIKSLFKGLSISSLPNPLSDGTQTYWCIEARIPKGNWAARILGNRATVHVSANITFEPEDENSGRFISIAYQIELNIRERKPVFLIRPNLKTHLAVCQRLPDMLLHTFGDSFGYSELTGSYTLVVQLKDTAGQPVGQVYRLKHYIIQGQPTT